MKPKAVSLAAVLCLGILTIWIDERWPWSAFQCAAFALAAWRICTPPRPRISAAIVPLAVAAAWPFVQVAAGITVSEAVTWVQALDWLTYLVVFALSCDILSEEGSRYRFLAGIAAFGALLAFVSTVQNYSSRGRIFWFFPSGFETDVFGPFVNHNQFAAWLELMLPVALYLALTHQHLRVVYGCASAVLFGCVVASTSRAGFALACGEVLLVGFAAVAGRSTLRTNVLPAAQFLVLAVVAAAALGWEGLAVRFAMGTPEVIRVDTVRASLRMVNDRPWTGSGLGTWSMTYPRYAGVDKGTFVNQAHNDWAQWAAEGGIPFVFFLAAFALLLCKPALRSIYGVGTLAFLLHAFVDYPLQQRPALAAWFFALAGAAMATASSRTREVSGTNDGLLRGIRPRPHGVAGGDPAGL